MFVKPWLRAPISRPIKRGEVYLPYTEVFPKLRGLGACCHSKI